MTYLVFHLDKPPQPSSLKCIPCVPAWSTYPHASKPKVWQLLIFTCQHANKRANMPKACQLLNLVCQRTKRGANFSSFSTFLKKFLNFWIFQLCITLANFKKIWTILENLSCETNNLNFDICEISFNKNLMNLKTLMLFSIEHVGLTKQLFD